MKKVKILVLISLIAGVAFAATNCSDIQQMLRDAVEKYQEGQEGQKEQSVPDDEF